MNKVEFIEKLKAVTKNNIDIDLTEIQAENMYFLSQKLVERNKVMNLTAICEENAIILKHLVDSMLLSKYIKPNSTLIDVGAGAGFPTLPLAIIRPDINILALDSTEKRVNYIVETAKELKLTNVKGIYGRAEEIAKNPQYREQFDYGSARAVASLPILSELVIPYVKLGGEMLAMKGPDAQLELNNSKNAIIKLSGAKSFTKTECDKYILKDTQEETRYIIKIPKVEKTPEIYPRIFSKIKKSPL